MKKIKFNDTLAELMMGILTSGIFIQMIELVIALANPALAGSRLSFSAGLWIGVFSALGLAMHMYRSIDIALDMPGGDAEKYMRKAYLIRTAAILVIAGIVHFLRLGYVMATFLGMLCLKFGAFLQPLMHKIREKSRK